MSWQLSPLRYGSRICLGISGGVDSTVAALLLKERRYEVIGVHMRNWDQRDELGHCSADKDAEDAERVCKKLDVPFKEVNLVKEYWQEVFEPLVADYTAGLTPNPDVICNERIKFDRFHRYCTQELGCEAVATGHYARNSYGEDLEYAHHGGPARLLQSADPFKDQTFFLSRVPQLALKRSLFPVGGLLKSAVKAVAESKGFPEVAARKESMGICFIGKRRDGFQEFISGYVEDNPGQVVDVDDGSVVGQHRGLHHWTLGQRIADARGRDPEARYVVKKNVEANMLVSCRGTDHPALFCEHFFACRPHWISGRPPDELIHGHKQMECSFRFQNTQPLTNCVVRFAMSGTSNWEGVDRGRLGVASAEPKRAVTPGQHVAFYVGDECVGSAVIERAGPSLLTMAGGSQQRRTEENRSDV